MSVFKKCLCSNKSVELSEYKHFWCSTISLIKMGDNTAVSCANKNEERPVLCEAIAYCKENRISTLLVSELSRMGRNAFEVLASVKELIDSGINLYIQKEQFNLLDDDGKPSLFTPVMLATLSTCAQLER